MASREEMLEFLNKKEAPSAKPSREQMLEFLQSKNKPEPESRKAEAALEGFGEGATLGYLNNLQAAAEKPITAVGNFLTGNDVEADDYVTARDSYNRRQAKLQEENPGSFAAGQVAGTVASSMPVAKAAQGATALARAGRAAAAGAGYGAVQNTSEQEGEVGNLNLGERAQNTAFGAVTGAGASLGADAVAKGLQKGARAISNTKNKLGTYLKKGAEDLAENATGATPAQSEKFRAGAGRELLDRGLVKFGDTAENVADRVGKAQSKAGQAIGDALEDLDKQGVVASVDNVVMKLETKIADLNKTPGNEKLIKQIQSEIDNLYSRGQSNIEVSTAEQAKRNFQGRTKWNNPDLIDQQSSAHLSEAFKDEVESAALKANPQLAAKFTEGKDTFSLLSPIREGAERRASQLNQSPMGGFLDVATTAAGGSVAGIPGAIAAGVTRRAISPRISSSMAVTMDKVSKQLLKNPQMSQLAKVNPEAFRATVFGLANDGAASPGVALPRAAENQTAQSPSPDTDKGEAKWIRTGGGKLSQAGVSQGEIEALQNSKAGRLLLIEASDASPDSKRMQAILKKIKTSSLNGAE